MIRHFTMTLIILLFFVTILVSLPGLAWFAVLALIAAFLLGLELDAYA